MATLINYKFNEDSILADFQEYLDSTYKKHYAADGGTQTFELIAKEPLRGLHFCQSNILKYSDRCEHKGQLESDLKKILHYSILALYCAKRLE